MLLDAVKKMMNIVEIQDSRDPKKVRYPLGPTLFAIILAWMCGYNSALQVEYFWHYKFKTQVSQKFFSSIANNTKVSSGEK